MTEAHELKVRKHFDSNFSFFKWFWMNKQNLSLHLGFWRKNTKNLHEALMNENKEVGELLNIKKSDIILDAGCGVGGTAIWIAENYGAKVIGIDITEKYIELAKKNAKERKVDHLVTFISGDYSNTSFANQYFTKIYSIEGFCYSENKGKFIKEVHRLLKPKGRLVLADYFAQERKMKLEDKDLLKKWCEEWVIPSLMNIETLEKDLKVGMKDVIFKDRTKMILPSSEKLRKSSIRLYPLLKFLYMARLVSEIPDKNVLLKEPLLFKKNIIKYCLVATEK